MGGVLHVGDIVDNKYEILRAIGRGGMSVVWLAQDKRLGKLWAIKEIRPNERGTRDETSRQALIDEANFMKRLDHPAIPRIVDILDDGSSVLVIMDYINGVALDRVLAERGSPFGQEEVIGWGVQLCDVLGYLHSLQPPVLYRDMKPSNVMLRDDGSVKLIDFGIALELEPGAAEASLFIGSGGYSPPEQIDSQARAKHPLDERADVYALGATLYSLVTGHTPHRVEAEGEVVTDFNIRPIREVDPALSDGLERILSRACQEDPRDRYPSIDAMRYDLDHHERLTQAWRDAQRRKVRSFTRLLRAAAITAALGIACLGGSALARSSSYEALMHDASLAPRQERQVTLASVSSDGVRTAQPSEAEVLITRAAELEPGRIEPYEELLRIYKADEVFSPTESERWIALWQRHGRSARGSPDYARLCYDVGVTYLCYYDFLGVSDQLPGDELVVTGQAALENATRSLVWFQNALDACDGEAGDYRGLRVDDTMDEYSALLAYQTIGAFDDKIARANREGADTTEEYARFWEAIGETVAQGGVADKVEPIVQLRLLQVAFESVSSPNNLVGFRRSGVTQEQALALLDDVERRVAALGEFAEGNSLVAAPLYAEVVEGETEARENILRTYSSPVARLSARAGEQPVDDAGTTDLPSANPHATDPPSADSQAADTPSANPYVTDLPPDDSQTADVPSIKPQPTDQLSADPQPADLPSDNPQADMPAREGESSR